ncbi:MAG: response regulator [Candidatus Omnitrophica bacterium]|jgi:DNA-binding response OmpR family regulator|nr:response regulator [Candidatus Omnitrophota bacterium]MDD5518402.1 response regulator [Candidatus Omnitrophota bacterium]
MGKAKILVVDDNEKNVELLEAILQAAGFDVQKAYDGKQAIEMVGKERPDLILLDIMMPQLDGFQVCEILRKDPQNAGLPVVMVTAKDKESDIVQSLERGADEYIVKPINQKELLSKIGDMLVKAGKNSLPSQFYFKKLESQPDKPDAP